MTQTKVVIVDDHPVFRQGLRDVLETDPEIQVVGEAANGEVALQMAEDVEPNVMLIDINLPDVNGLQVTRQIRAKQPDIKVIVVTGYDDAEQAFHAIRAGASAYCAKDITPETLIQTIYAVQQDRYVVGERKMSHDEVVVWVEEKVGRISGRLITDTEDSFVPLSPREMEILEYVTHGRSNKEIAYALGISHQTVKNHMTAILRKLQVDDRTQAAVYALSRGWVRLDKPLRD
ncbi:MAG TPA: response regulator transcription factor [Anaerolineae bacterium]|jgi:DNA-binding NarL/FixJ family response regulator|nr:response regulator transcription factor [Anaerolineae bacterium]